MGDAPKPISIEDHPVHLGLGATANVEPLFDGDLSWYEAYGRRHEADGVEGRLVSTHTFSSSWDMWEMHPKMMAVNGRIFDLSLLESVPVKKLDGARHWDYQKGPPSYPFGSSGPAEASKA